jgi:nucleoside-diphosphate-sugar epimerase
MIIKKKIIVTGATGYIGFNFVKRYVDNFDFICFVRKSSNIEELKTFASDIIYIDNYDQINKAFADYQVSGVVHFATIKTSLLDIIDCNITFSSYLLEQAALNNVDWFINTGSYWQNCNGDKYNPANFYASSKEAFENIGCFFNQKHGIKFYTLRLSDVYGPNDPRKNIFSLFKYALENKNHELNMTDGYQKLSLCYIEDVTSAYFQLIDNIILNVMDQDFDAFQVPGYCLYSVRDVVDEINQISSVKLNPNWGSINKNQKAVIGYNSPLEVLPLWAPKIPLKEGLINVFNLNEEVG